MKKTHKLFIICVLCTILTIASVMVCSPLYTKQSTFIVKFNQETETDISYKIWWATSKDENFSSRRAVIRKVPATQKDVTINLPTNKIARFRIDPASDSETNLKISDLKIQRGDSVIYTFDNMEDFRFHVAKNVRVKRDQDTISLLCGLPVPKIEYQKELNLWSKDTHDPYVLFSIILISSMLFFYLGLRIQNTEKAWEKILFIIVFVCICCIPASKIDTSAISKKEKRKLAPCPQMIANNKGGLNIRYGKEFESWLQDRFAFRSDLIKFHDSILYFITGIKENKKSVKFANNWTFSKPYLDALINGYKKSEIDKAVRNLQLLNDWCAKRNIKFYLLICPTKERVYSDMNPRIGNLNQIKAPYDINYLISKLVNINYVYPIAEAITSRQQNPGTLLYYKQDTHFSEDGAHLFYNVTMQRIQKDFPNQPIMQKTDNRLEVSKSNKVLKAEPLDNLSYENESPNYFFGDLGGGLSLKDENYDVPYNHYTLKGGLEVKASRVKEPMQTLYTCPTVSSRAVLLGESTTSYIRHWFKYSFGELLRLRCNNNVAPNNFSFSRWERQIETFKPDALIICLYESWLVTNLSQLY